MSAVAVLSWDWREQPDLDRLDFILANLSGGRMRAFSADTGSDQFAVVIVDGDEHESADVDVPAVFARWEADGQPASIMQWPGSSSGGTT